MSWRNQPGMRAGSRPRCVSLMEGAPDVVAERLTQLVGLPDVVVTPDSKWLPEGLPVQRLDGSWDVAPADEARLDKPNALLTEGESEQLSKWWLAHSGAANTPNWDIASTCKVAGRNGILLVEAKAHAAELTDEVKGKQLDARASGNSFANHVKIGQAIAESAVQIQRSTGESCAISRDRHYQMSNRFAVAAKLTEMGLPVVLVYLGFLNASEMAPKDLLTSDETWRTVVKQHSAAIDVGGLWDKRWQVNGQLFLPLIRSIDWPL
jgi:hypothetical protein